MRTFRNLAVAALAAVSATAASLAGASAFPDKPITATVAFPPGGATDLTARLMMPKMSEILGQPVVIENRPGATGAVGATLISRAKPDGYNLLVASIGTFTTNPFLQKGLQYDPLKTLDLMTVAVQTPAVLLASKSFPVNTVPELIDYMKKNPGKVSYASSGAGSSDHLIATLLMLQADVQGVHIPYKGGGPAMTDLLGGHVNLIVQNLPAIIEQIKADQVKPLAITSDARHPMLPNVPTFKELGYPELVAYPWQAIAAPPGLPADVKAKLHDAMVKALHDPSVKGKFEEIGFEVVANTPDEFRTFLQKEMDRWGTVIKKGNITAD